MFLLYINTMNILKPVLKNILLKPITKKNVMVINYNFTEACVDDYKFLYESLLETMETYKFNFKLMFQISDNIGIEIIRNNNIMEEKMLRLFRMKAHKHLHQYTDKYN